MNSFPMTAISKESIRTPIAFPFSDFLMQFSVFSSSCEKQIVERIIKRISINMMDDFIGCKFSPKMAFHHKSMQFFPFFMTNFYFFASIAVSIFMDLYMAIRRFIFASTTTISISMNMTWKNLKSFTTTFTNFKNGFHKTYDPPGDK